MRRRGAVARQPDEELDMRTCVNTTRIRARPVPYSLAALVLALAAGCGGADSDRATLASTAGSAGASPAAKVAAGDVHRFAKLSNGAYFFTGDEAEKDLILSGAFPDFRYEGVGFRGASGSDAVAVHRFANTANGGYFYTASLAERDAVLANPAFAHFRYEGASFSVAAPLASGSVPVFRLANLRNGAYLYTSSAEEWAAATALGFWRSEGIGFWAFRPR